MDPRERFQEVRTRMDNGEWFVFWHITHSHEGCAISTDRYHREVRKFRGGLGYHYVISNGHPYTDQYFPRLVGMIEVGRKLGTSGAHVRGLNHRSVGIAFVAWSGQEIELLQLTNAFLLTEWVMDHYQIKKIC